MSDWRKRLIVVVEEEENDYRDTGSYIARINAEAIRAALAEVAKLEAELVTERAANAQMREALDVAIACENAAKAELAAVKTALEASVVEGVKLARLRGVVEEAIEGLLTISTPESVANNLSAALAAPATDAAGEVKP